MGLVWGGRRAPAAIFPALKMYRVSGKDYFWERFFCFPVDSHSKNDLPKEIIFIRYFTMIVFLLRWSYIIYIQI